MRYSKLNFGYLLRNKRLILNYSQSGIAAAIAVNLYTYRTWEQNISFPNVKHLLQLINLLKLKLHKPLDLEDLEKSNNLDEVFEIFKHQLELAIKGGSEINPILSANKATLSKTGVNYLLACQILPKVKKTDKKSKILEIYQAGIANTPKATLASLSNYELELLGFSVYTAKIKKAKLDLKGLSKKAQKINNLIELKSTSANWSKVRNHLNLARYFSKTEVAALKIAYKKKSPEALAQILEKYSF
jgi:transcriptional regulator with XRE-family HTH domain